MEFCYENTQVLDRVNDQQKFNTTLGWSGEEEA